MYKVVLVFNLTSGSANEELRRSAQDHSFPNLLARQPGFVALELVKISEDKTMSAQTWETERHWWSALENVKQLSENGPVDQARENILVSRDFLGGTVVSHLSATPSVE